MSNLFDFFVYETLPVKGLRSYFVMFLKEVSYAHQGCIYIINHTLLLQFKITVI